MKKYFFEFLVVFFGILLSFMIDNRIKYSDRVDNKNFLLGQLDEVISEDQNQLKIVESTLKDCLESISILIYDYKNDLLHDSVVVSHFSNVSSKLTFSLNSFEITESREGFSCSGYRSSTDKSGIFIKFCCASIISLSANNSKRS